MTSALTNDSMISALPLLRVEVVESGQAARRGWQACAIGTHLKFSTERLETYCFADWQPVIFDMLLVAAAVEYCDKILRRPKRDWGRHIELRLPVHEPDRWQAPDVAGRLKVALEHLTGDKWELVFVERKRPEEAPRQSRFTLPASAQAVIPYSDGLDSRAVAGLMSESLGGGLIRLRLGSVGCSAAIRRQPFASIPYEVHADRAELESSGRSRGFKFALIGAVGAYLSGTGRIIMPESAQGALGPALVPVGQAYEDYRNHPLFTQRMASFASALLGRDFQFEYPRLWSTKGETLRAFAATRDGGSWSDTRSCWQQSRQASLDGRRRQCGICAACLLRRMSVHAAGLIEPGDAYIWENLSARTFAEGAAAGFNRVTGAMREYAIAGTLHLDHLAGLAGSPAHADTLKHRAFQVGRALGLSELDASAKLHRVLGQHEKEWRGYMDTLGSESFLADWARGAR